MVTKKKKIIVLSVMMLLLVATGFLNLTLNTQASATNTVSNTETLSFFESYRADRNTAREQQKLYYNSILESASASETSKKSAEESLTQLASKIEKELVLEGSIMAKGFTDAVVSFSDSFVNVMVKADVLSDSQVAQIVEVIQQQTNKSIDNIKIIPIE